MKNHLGPGITDSRTTTDDFRKFGTEFAPNYFYPEEKDEKAI